MGVLRLILVFCLACYFVVDGGRGIYEAANFSELKDRTLDQLVKERPDMGYVRVSGGHFDYSNIVTEKSKSSVLIDRVLVPYVADGSPATVLVSTRDEEILEAISSGRKPPTVTQFQGTIGRNSDSAVTEFKRGNAALNEPVVVIIHNGEPSSGLALCETIVGVAIFAFFGFLVWSTFAEQTVGPGSESALTDEQKEDALQYLKERVGSGQPKP
jgi:hypothetical protein